MRKIFYVLYKTWYIYFLNIYTAFIQNMSLLGEYWMKNTYKFIWAFK